MSDTPGTVHDRASRNERRRLRVQQQETAQRRPARLRRIRAGLRWGVLGLVAALGLEAPTRIHRRRLILEEVPAVVQSWRRHGQPE